MYLVEEYQVVKVTYVADTASRVGAELAVSGCKENVEQASVEPELVEVQKREARKLTDKDREDFVVDRAVRFLNSSNNEPEVPVKKKRGRPKGSKNKPKE